MCGRYVGSMPRNNRYNFSMDDDASATDTLRRWVATWQTAGPALDAIRQRELAGLTDDEVRRRIADLFPDDAVDDRPLRPSSGLIEQQRYFARLRETE